MRERAVQRKTLHQQEGAMRFPGGSIRTPCSSRKLDARRPHLRNRLLFLPAVVPCFLRLNYPTGRAFRPRSNRIEPRYSLQLRSYGLR